MGGVISLGGGAGGTGAGAGLSGWGGISGSALLPPTFPQSTVAGAREVVVYATRPKSLSTESNLLKLPVVVSSWISESEWIWNKRVVKN